jgi:hypothetical protein
MNREYFPAGLMRVAGLFALPFLGCDALSAVAIFVTIGILAGAAWSTSGPCLVEMGPNFVGTVYGLFNMGFTIVAIIAPVVSASFIKGNASILSRIYYYLVHSLSYAVLGIMTSPNNDLRASNKKKSYTSSSILW